MISLVVMLICDAWQAMQEELNCDDPDPLPADHPLSNDPRDKSASSVDEANAGNRVAAG